MKDLEFHDYTKTYQDADGDEHVSTVRAAIITSDLARVPNAQGNPIAREVNTFTGARQVVEGDVFVELPGKEGVYDHLTAEGWESSGYTRADQNTSDRTVSEPVVTETEPVQPEEPVQPVEPDKPTLRKLPGNDNNA